LIELKTVKNKFLHESAGKIMIRNFPRVLENSKIKEVEKYLFRHKNDFETISYIFVVDEKQVIKGVLSIKELFRAKKHETVSSLISSKKLIYVHFNTDQEKVAHLALKNKLKAIPVVDKKKRLIGIVPYSVLMSVLDFEAREDLFRFGGISDGVKKQESMMTMGVLKSLKHRLPWLVVGLFGGILASGVVKGFEEVLSKNLILAAFIPLIVYISDAVGSQMQAFIIRDLSLNENLKIFKIFIKQLSVVSVIGVILSVILFLLLILLYSNFTLGFVISFALFCAIISSFVSGLFIPYLFNLIKVDPANASGPIATIVQDLLSVFIYFSIGAILL